MKVVCLSIVDNTDEHIPNSNFRKLCPPSGCAYSKQKTNTQLSAVQSMLDAPRRVARFQSFGGQNTVLRGRDFLFILCSKQKQIVLATTKLGAVPSNVSPVASGLDAPVAFHHLSLSRCWPRHAFSPGIVQSHQALCKHTRHCAITPGIVQSHQA